MSMTETKVEWRLYFIKIKPWDFIVMAVSIHKKKQKQDLTFTARASYRLGR